MVTDLDWKTIRKALKNDGATLNADSFGHYWLELPIDHEIARQIISHPAIVRSDETDRCETFRWRESSPAGRVL